MKIIITLFALIQLMPFCTSAQNMHVPLSPLQELSQVVGQTKIKLSYSRPAIRDRIIFGGLVPYDEMWRTGANRNSKIQFSRPVQIANKKIDKGTYAILTKPGKVNWEVYFYSDTTNWEVPNPWVDSLIAAQLTVPVKQSQETIQSMRFSIEDITYESCRLSLAWENTMIDIPIELYTEEQLLGVIDKVLSGPTASDYNAAARYRLQTGKDLKQAISWIDQAMTLRSKPSFYDYLIKARILNKQSKSTEALAAAKRSMELAQAGGNAYRIGLVQQLLDKLKN